MSSTRSFFCLFMVAISFICSTSAITHISKQGKMNFISEGVKYCINKVSAVFFNSGIVHSIACEDESVISAIQFDHSITIDITNKRMLILPIVSNKYKIDMHLERIKNEYHAKHPYYEVRIK